VNGRNSSLLGLAVGFAVLAAAGCGRDNLTNPAMAPRDPIVFDDDFGAAVDYQAFSDSKTDAVQMDFAVAFNGPASLRVTVPGPDAVDGTFAGGAFTTFNARDLSGYNALTFYAKSEMDVTLNIAGLANDNTGTSLYESSRDAIPLTEDWVRVIVPIPNPSRLTAERGLFFFAEGHENNMGYDFWMDEIKFELIDGITDPRPVMDTKTQTTFVGGSVEVSGTSTTFDLNGADVVINHLPACFDYFSSNEAAATVADGIIDAIGSGTATVTGKLDTVDVEGAVTVNVMAGPDGPAPEPTIPPEDVISLFSDVYDDVAVNTWHAPWTGSTGEVADFQIDGDDVKLYTDLNFAGIEFVGENLIDAATPGMTHLHLDVWAPSGGLFKVKLVDFGANGAYDGGGDDSEFELLFNGGTVPPFFSGQWSDLDIPLADFLGLASTEHLAQLVISSSDVTTVIVDNVYFHK
jgi:hypothetical protein